MLSEAFKTTQTLGEREYLQQTMDKLYVKSQLTVTSSQLT